MRIPKPRLRQVFEHTTSFKVKKPTGQTITIAKKGLSPSTIGRLRRFAQGGEVQGYDNGGEVLTPEELRMSQEAQALAQPQGEQPAVVEAAPVVEEQPVLSVPRKVVTVQANQAALAAPAPAQPNITIINFPVPQSAAMKPVEAPAAPAAAPQKLQAAPQAEKAAQEAPAKPAKEGEPGFVSPPQPRPEVPIIETPLPAAPVAEEAVPPVVVPPAVVPTKPYEFGYKPRLLGRDLAAPVAEAPIFAPATMAATAAPVAAEPPAPAAAAAPVAPAAAAAPVAPAPVAAPRSITAEALRDEAKKIPNATVADLVARIAGPDAAIDPVVMQSAAQIPAVEMLRAGKLADAYVAGVAQELNTAQLEANAQIERARIEQEALNAERLRAAEKAKADIERAEALRTHSKQLEQEAMASDNLKSFFDSQGTAYSVLSVVSLAIGGFLSGYTNTPNYVLKAFNDAMDKDLEEQKRRRNSKWSRYKEVLGDADAADLLVRADNDQLASIAIKKASLQQNVAKIRPELERLQAQLQQKAALNMAALDLKLAQAEDEREKAAPRVFGGRGAPKPSLATEFRIKKYETERTMNVGDVPVQRNTDKQADKIATDLGNRNFMAHSLAEIVKLFDNNPPDVAINILRQTRGEMLARIATSIELFPTGFGFQRAVTDVAKKQLKEALQDPNSFKAFILEMSGDRDAATGIKTLFNEVTAARREFVLNKADPSSARDKQAAELGLWNLESKDAVAAGRKAPAKPKLTLPETELLTVPYSRAQQPAPAATPALGAPTPAPAAGGTKKFTHLKPIP